MTRQVKGKGSKFIGASYFKTPESSIQAGMDNQVEESHQFEEKLGKERWERNRTNRGGATGKKRGVHTAPATQNKEKGLGKPCPTRENPRLGIWTMSVANDVE